MIPRATQQSPALGSARVHHLNGSDKLSPALRKMFGEFLFSRQNVGYSEIVFSEDCPDPPSRSEVSRILNGAEDISQCTKEGTLFRASAAADPAEDSSILIVVGIHTELCGVLVDRTFVLKSFENGSADLLDTSPILNSTFSKLLP
jgi:hypothetical protein